MGVLIQYGRTSGAGIQWVHADDGCTSCTIHQQLHGWAGKVRTTGVHACGLGWRRKTCGLGWWPGRTTQGVIAWHSWWVLVHACAGAGAAAVAMAGGGGGESEGVAGYLSWALVLVRAG